MTVLYFVTLLATGIVGVPFAVLMYSLLVRRQLYRAAESALARIIACLNFSWQFVLATCFANIVSSRVFGIGAWRQVLGLVVYIVGASAAMASLHRLTHVLRFGTRVRFSGFLLIAVVTLICQGLLDRFVLSVYYLPDEGLKSGSEGRLGSPGGPQVGLASHVGYYLLRPARGAVVTIYGEKAMRIPPTWQRDVPDRFHYYKEGVYLGRVVGMPGESVTLYRGIVRIGDKELRESYVRSGVTEETKTELRLGQTDFLLAEDVRKDHSKSENAFYIAHEKQIISRQFFLLWPPRHFGFVELPHYNVPNPAAWNLHINERWLRRLVMM